MPSGLVTTDPSAGAEITRLRAQIADLERQLHAAARFESLVRRLPIGLDILHHEDRADPTAFRLIFTNNAISNHQITMADHVGQRLREIFPHMPDHVFARYTAALSTGEAVHLQELVTPMPDGEDRTAEVWAIPLDVDHLCIMIADITDRTRMQAAQQELARKEALIQVQQQSLNELSTPLIPITDGVVVMPLIGTMDSTRAEHMLATLLDGIASMRAIVAILDITGVPVVDTHVANALIQAAQMVRLLGAQVILTGIRPEVAQTLVGLGVDLAAITTLSSLQRGIAYATTRA
jgi:rsbT co-antagonist protein RsbR